MAALAACQEPAGTAATPPRVVRRAGFASVWKRVIPESKANPTDDAFPFRPFLMFCFLALGVPVLNKRALRC